MKKKLSFNDIKKEITSMPSDFDVFIKCFNKTHPAGDFFIYPNNLGEVSFDLSKNKKISDYIDFFKNSTFIKNHSINFNSTIWASFPKILSGMYIYSFVVDQEKKSITFLTKRD